MSNINDIVSEVLRSPELRHNLETTIRSLTFNGSNSGSGTPEVSKEPAHSVRQELHRLFPTIGRRNEDAKGRKRKKAYANQSYFYRDIILLKNPKALLTLKGPSKSIAFEKVKKTKWKKYFNSSSCWLLSNKQKVPFKFDKEIRSALCLNFWALEYSKTSKLLTIFLNIGLGFSNAQFNCNWTYEEIFKNIEELFKQRLEGKQFEIMVPIGGRLIKPSLPPGTQLDGKTMKSIFTQKVVYVRPTQQIESDDEEIHTNEEISSIFVDYSNKVELEVDEVFENDLELALRNSLKGTADDSNISLQLILKNLNCQINNEKITYLNVYRQDIFNCCIRAMRRKSFSPFNKISVRFSDIEGNSEGAVDSGGPMREMFRLVLDYIKNSRLFFGDKKYIRLDMEALGNHEYLEAGRLISLSFIHGGPGPHFFSESLYSVLINGISNEFPTIDDIEEEMKEKILKLNEITDIQALQEYITEEQLFFIAGHQFIKSMEEKKKLVKDVVQFYGFHRIRPALEQFKEGLSSGHIFELMQCHSTLFKDIMCNSKTKITANVLEGLFTIEFSEVGSSNRIQENRAVSFWRDFLLDCEDDSTGLTLEDILIFSTGADAIPPLGFEYTPTIVFNYENEIYPKANTCSLQLQLPTIHKT